jgi:hypothetical protein
VVPVIRLSSAEDRRAEEVDRILRRSISRTMSALS